MKLIEGQVRIVIPSRGRWRTIGQKSAKWLPSATIFVHSEEELQYRAALPKAEIVAHGPCRTLGHLRNMALDTFNEECVVLVDDDLHSVTSLVGMRVRPLKEPETILALIHNAAEIAKHTGSWLFGFAVNPSPRYFDPLNPMCLKKTKAYCIIGIVGRQVRYDERLSMFDDRDLNLQTLKAGGNIFADSRFLFQFEQVGSTGGNFVQFRNTEKEQIEADYLFKKWGERFSRKSIQ